MIDDFHGFVLLNTAGTRMDCSLRFPAAFNNMEIVNRS